MPIRNAKIEETRGAQMFGVGNGVGEAQTKQTSSIYVSYPACISLVKLNDIFW